MSAAMVLIACQKQGDTDESNMFVINVVMLVIFLFDLWDQILFSKNRFMCLFHKLKDLSFSDT